MTTRRVIDLKTLITSIVVCLVVGVCGFGIHQYQLGKMTKRVLEQSVRCENNNDLANATKYLEKYLNTTGEELDQVIRLARLFEARLVADPGNQKLLAKAIQANYRVIGVIEDFEPTAETDEVRIRLAGQLIELERLPEAIEVLAPIEEASAVYAKANSLAAIASFQIAMLSNETPRSVGAALERALELNPSDLEVIKCLAQYNTRDPALTPEEQVSKAEATLQRFEGEPSAESDFMRYQIRTAYPVPFSIQELRNDLSAALKKSPSFRPAIIALADVMIRSGNPIDSKKLLNRAIQLDEEAFDAYYKLSQVELSLGQLKDAMEANQQGLRQVPESDLLGRWKLVTQKGFLLLRQPGQPEELNGLINEIGKQFSSLKLKLTRQARIQFQNEFDLLVASKLIRDGEFESSIQRLERIVSLQTARNSRYGVTNEATAQYLLGIANRSSGNIERALDYFKTADRLYPIDIRALNAALELLMEKNRIEDIRRLLIQAIADKTRPVEICVGLASRLLRYESQLPQAQRAPTLAKESLLELAERAPSNDRVPFLLIAAEMLQVKSTEEKQESASNILQSVASNKTSAEFWLKAASTFEKLGNRERADNAIKKLKQLAPESPLAIVGEAQLHWSREEYDEAVNLISKAIIEGKSTEQESVLRKMLYQMRLERDEIKHAAALLEDSLRQIPNDLYFNIEGYRHAAKKKELEKCETILRRIIGIVGSKSRIVLALKLERQLLQPELGEKSRVSLKSDIGELLEAEPAWGEPHRLMGIWFEGEGDLAQASDAYVLALRKGSRNRDTLESLLSILYRTGRVSEARILLSEVFRELPSTSALTSFGIIEGARTGSLKAAKSLAERATRKRPKDPQNWVWLSQLLQLTGSPREEVDAAIDMAESLDESEITVFVAKTIMMLNRKEFEKARSRIKSVPDLNLTSRGEKVPLQIKLQTSAALSEQLASASLEEEDNARVEAFLRKAAENSKSPLDRLPLARYLAVRDLEGAKQIYNSIIATTDLLSVRIEFAEILAIYRTKENWKLAKHTLESVEPKDRRKARDHLARIAAKIKDFRFAIEYFKTESPTPKRVRVLAGWSELGGFKQEALKYRKQLADSDEATELDHAKLIDLMIATKSFGEAHSRIDRFVEGNGDPWRQFALRSKLLLAEGRAKEAANLIDDFLEKNNAYVVKIQTAKFLDSIGSSDLAISIWKSIANQSSQNRRSYILSLARAGQSEDAIALCLSEKDLVSKAMTLNEVLSLGPDDVYRAHFETMIKLNRDANSRTVWHQAFVCHLRHGNRPQAIQVAEQLHRVSPKDPLVLNNLAGLLIDDDASVDRAETLMQKAFELAKSPNDVLLDTMGMVELAAGRPNKALNHFAKLATNGNPDPRHFLHIAAAHVLSNEQEQLPLAKASFDQFKRQGFDLKLLTARETSWLKLLQRTLN